MAYQNIPTSSESVASAIVFFDGHCLLCNSFVDFIIKRDGVALFKFAPLQGQAAQKYLPPELCETANPKSIVLLWNNQLYTHSDAVIRILVALGGVWKIAATFRIVPRVVRDWIYRIVADNRYWWFGLSTSCRFPTEHERFRFLE